MKKQILAACVAALSLGAGGCTEAGTQGRPTAVTVAPEPPRVDAAIRDAGMPITQAAEVVQVARPLDVVGLAHEDGRMVDHLARSSMLRDEGDLDGALAEARRAVFDAPDDPDALARVDRIAKLAGDKKLRVAALERLAAVQKDDATPLIQQARVLISMKDYEGALRIAQQATTRDGSNPEAFQAMGRAYLSLGQLSSAISSFEHVVALDPDHGHALNNLGFALLRANENEEALAVLQRAAKVLPHLAWVQNNLGVALERMGRKDEAKDAYAKASDLSPKYVKARVNASRVASVSPQITDQVPEPAAVEPDPSTEE